MKKVLSVVYSAFPSDPRPRREAEAMVEAGFEVDIICLKKPEQKAREKLYGVNVFRVNMKRRRNSRFRYILQYISFFFISLYMTTQMHLKKKYDVVHVHNLPDFLVFSAVLPKLMGAKIILDLHDPMPELFMTKYNKNKNSLFIKLLMVIENISIKFANIIITPNITFKDIFVSRGSESDKIHIVMNSPMEKIFSERLIQKNNSTEIGEGSFNIMFHGYIADHNGLSTALEAVSIARKEITDLQFDVFGGGEILEKLKSYADHLQLGGIVNFHGAVNLDVIAEQIAKSDLGIIPNRNTPFTNINFPTRIFEYLSLKKPVVVPRTKGILDYFKEGEICFFEPGNAEDLARTILELWKDPKLREQYVLRGFPIYFEKRWALQKKQLVKLVEGVS